MSHSSDELADIAVIGLAVMGRNLILNMADHGFQVIAYNRTKEKIDEFLETEASGMTIKGAYSVEELAIRLKKPRRIMLMVKAGQPVDDTIEQILPVLDPGDIVIDGGNSLYTDTNRRLEYLKNKGILYVGTGVSGGEEGARHGPSIMPGGSVKAWPHIKDILQSIAAKMEDGTPCCDWVGEGGSGHYVKMVHNGIEYGDMQLISESYQLMRDYLALDNDKISEIFNSWNKGTLDSYLIKITADIMAYKDNDGMFLIDKILDAAGQKGTGKWTVISSAELAQPVSMISEAVFSRIISALKVERVAASKVLSGPIVALPPSNPESFIEDIGQALYASKIVSYTQGYMLMAAADREFNWDLNYGGIALMWSGGCIIRSRFLKDIKKAYDEKPELISLLLDPFFIDAIKTAQPSWRRVVIGAVKAGIPLPAMSSALAFYDSYRSDKLPANLIQAQRDYFGAHTYERLDMPRGQFFHTNWTGLGGATSSGTYIA
ncbi:MAG: decarboxylating NADP(+)-dependent phosphogluconate dehydrogenase [Candidatus Saccharimonadales bacterium]